MHSVRLSMRTAETGRAVAGQTPFLGIYLWVKRKIAAVSGGLDKRTHADRNAVVGIDRPFERA